ncbi:MAG: YeeE/YedE family protein [Acidobacteriia bacterium]|nr:YeeE/YedE family protein [Terriglobia bacterium]
MATTTFDSSLPRQSLNSGPVGLALTLIVLGAGYLSIAVTWRQGALFLVGAGAGVALYHAAFGFTFAWRTMIVEGRGGGLRAQMLMLAVTCAVFLPLLAHGQIFGHRVHGSVSPVSLSVIAGAFLFGMGMQLGDGCASGTLYAAGGGSVRMLVTLAAFIVGSVIGALHMPFWQAAPAFQPISLLSRLGLAASLGVSLLLFGAVALASLIVERRRHGSLVDRAAALAKNPVARREGSAWLIGPWPLVAGALSLAAVNIATLVLAGRPWGITSAFALWGSKVLAALGVGVAAWPYWQPAGNAAALRESVFSDITSVMDIGILLGALMAAGLAGRFAPFWRVPTKSLLAAVIGGLMLGYGARIAYGCNIGAFFSGVSSSSVHGWLWFVAAFAGNGVGTRIRPLFGLRV